MFEPEGLFGRIRDPEIIKVEIGKIRYCFLQRINTFEGDPSLQRYIQFHQAAIVWLMDEMFCSAEESELENFQKAHVMAKTKPDKEIILQKIQALTPDS
jgi:hypothetical protein